MKLGYILSQKLLFWIHTSSQKRITSWSSPPPLPLSLFFENFNQGWCWNRRMKFPEFFKFLRTFQFSGVVRTGLVWKQWYSCNINRRALEAEGIISLGRTPRCKLYLFSKQSVYGVSLKSRRYTVYVYQCIPSITLAVSKINIMSFESIKVF